MKRLCSLMLTCAFLLAFFVISIEAEELQKTKVAPAKKITAVKAQKAKSVEVPQAASKRNQLSSTGYGSDPGEDTQERPKPLDTNAAKTRKPIQGSVQSPR